MIIKVLPLQIKLNPQVKKAVSAFIAVAVFIYSFPAASFARYEGNLLRPASYSQRSDTAGNIEAGEATKGGLKPRKSISRRSQVDRILSETAAARDLHSKLFDIVGAIESGRIKPEDTEEVKGLLVLTLKELKKERLASMVTLVGPGERIINFVTTSTKIFNDEILGYARTTDLLRARQTMLRIIISEVAPEFGLSVAPIASSAVVDTFVLGTKGVEPMRMSRFLGEVNSRLSEKLQCWLDGEQTGIVGIRPASREIVSSYENYKKIHSGIAPIINTYFGVSAPITAPRGGHLNLIGSFIEADVEAMQSARIAKAHGKSGGCFSEEEWGNFIRETAELGSRLKNRREDFFKLSETAPILNEDLAYYLRLWGFEGAVDLEGFVRRHNLSGWWVKEDEERTAEHEKDLREALEYLSRANFLDYIPNWSLDAGRARERTEKAVYAINRLNKLMDSMGKGEDAAFSDFLMPLRVAAEILMRDPRNDRLTSPFEFDRRAASELAAGRTSVYLFLDYEKIGMKNLERFQLELYELNRMLLKKKTGISEDEFQNFVKACAHITDNVTMLLRRNEEKVRQIVENHRVKAVGNKGVDMEELRQKFFKELGVSDFFENKIDEEEFSRRIEEFKDRGLGSFFADRQQQDVDDLVDLTESLGSSY